MKHKSLGRMGDVAHTANDLMIEIWSKEFEFIVLIKRRNLFLMVLTHYNVVLWELVNCQELLLYDFHIIYSPTKSSKSQHICDTP